MNKRTTPIKCAYHPGQKAAARCRQCQKPLCEQCALPAEKNAFLCGLCSALEAVHGEKAVILRSGIKHKVKISISEILRGVFSFIVIFGVLVLLLGFAAKLYNIGLWPILVISTILTIIVLFVLDKISDWLSVMIWGTTRTDGRFDETLPTDSKRTDDSTPEV